MFVRLLQIAISISPGLEKPATDFRESALSLHPRRSVQSVAKLLVVLTSCLLRLRTLRRLRLRLSWRCHWTRRLLPRSALLLVRLTARPAEPALLCTSARPVCVRPASVSRALSPSWLCRCSPTPSSRRRLHFRHRRVPSRRFYRPARAASFPRRRPSSRAGFWHRSLRAGPCPRPRVRRLPWPCARLHPCSGPKTT